MLVLSGAALANLMQAVLDKDRLFRFRARGRSMTPFIRDGDVLTIAPLVRRSLRVGEVVAFVHPHGECSGPVVHRVVGRRRAGFVIQGDAGGSVQEIVSPESIAGWVVKVEGDGCSIRVGLGPERRLIAWLTRTRLLWTLVWPVWNLAKRAFKGKVPCR
jgi:hypothetical protein